MVTTANGKGFGSCHALVSWWVCAAMACAKCSGDFGGESLKKRRVGCYFIVNRFVGRILVQIENLWFVKCQPFCLKTKFFRSYGTQRLAICSCGHRALLDDRSGMPKPTSCDPSHVINLNRVTESNEDTEPGHCRNIFVSSRILVTRIHIFLKMLSYILILFL